MGTPEKPVGQPLQGRLDVEQATLDHSASEYVAERLSKTHLGFTPGAPQPDTPIRRHEGTSGAPAPAGAAYAEGQLAAPRVDVAAVPPTAAAPAEAGSSASSDDVDALLRQAGFITRLNNFCYSIPIGHVKGMRVPARFYANPALLSLVVNELHAAGGGFTAAVNQLSNVATLPGIVGASIGMPDIHSGYGFAIGNVAAFDMDGEGVVSPGGVGFDINCGVRVLCTNLHERDLPAGKRQRLADTLFDLIPVGVGESGVVKLSKADLDAVLRDGMQWTERKGISWPEDRQVCEEGGCFAGADPAAVSDRAKKRGLGQLGSLGSGNHYTEVQVVDQIYDKEAAAVMGITEPGQVMVMIHTGSRGLGHQVCTDALAATDRAMARAKVKLVDRQLACMPIASPEGAAYLAAMKAAANFAFCNRTVVMSCVRRAFQDVFGKTARELGMHMVYDVAHNVAKEEEHLVDGKRMRLLVHRKGATRAFAPRHPSLPDKYQEIGQPVLIGGSMGTASYILLGTETAMKETFGSTCHGAGRALSRSAAIKTLDSQGVLSKLAARGICVRVATRHLAAEEAPESYKDVDAVVETCHAAGISRKVVRLRPIAVVKG